MAGENQDGTLHVSSEYISAGCNPGTCVIDWGDDNIIAYGVYNSIALLSPYYEKGKVNNPVILCILHGHKSSVSCVKWARKTDRSHEFLSGSADGVVKIWTKNSSSIYECSNTLEGHTDGIYSIDAVKYDNTLIITTASIDGTIKIWRRDNAGNVACVDTLDFRNTICLSPKIIFLPHNPSSILLVCATTDHYVYFYHSDIDRFENSKFTRCFALRTNHRDWIRSCDFIEDNGSILLATGSQDAMIKVWRIVETKADEEEHDTFSAGQTEKKYSIKLETILRGHEGWIYAVAFKPPQKDEDSIQRIKLLSVSMDKMVILWKIDKAENVWIEDVRLGKVGGDNLGFLGGCFSPSGKDIIAYDFNGDFYIWNQRENSWVPEIICRGHCKTVTDVQWDPAGQYIVSCSEDKTVRVHAPCLGCTGFNDRPVWNEFARPQLHGYTMNCVAVLPKCRFASASEEKNIRCFVATKQFVRNCSLHCGFIDVDENDFESYKVQRQLLNLSGDVSEIIEDAENANDGAPLSAELQEHTLWPEVCKLYSHPSEVVALVASSDGKILASACQGTTAEECAIVIWSTETWKEIEKLYAHELAVTQLAFSPNDKYLLSVSRDRRWSIFEKTENAVQFRKIDGTQDKDTVHKRIIFCCSWTHDSSYFVTGSREGKVVIWGRCESKAKITEIYSSENNNLVRIEPDAALSKDLTCRKIGTNTLYFPMAVILFKKEAVTGISFAPGFVKNNYFFAVGFESGHIRYISWNAGYCCDHTSSIKGDLYTGHSAMVRRITFRPRFGRPGAENSSELLLASCGKDHVVYIHKLYFS